MVVSKIITLFFLYILFSYTIYYLLFIYIMLLPTTFILIYYKINILEVGSNSVFQCSELTTLILFVSKIMLHRCFLYRFSVIFQCFLLKNRKKSANFLQFFLSVYQ